MLLCNGMFNKQVIFFIALLLVTTSIIKGQFFVGFDVGYNYNHLNTDISDRDYTKNTNENGYCIGLQFNYHLINLLSLQTGVGILQKNYSFTRTENYLGVHETFTNSYLQVPLTLQIRIFEKKKFQIFFNIGFYEAYWTFANVNGAIPNIFNTTSTIRNDGQIVQYLSLTNYSEKYQFNSLKDNRFESGLITGISINYDLNNKYSAFIESNYYQSLTDQQKKYMINQISKINQTLCISIGCLMKFSTNKN